MTSPSKKGTRRERELVNELDSMGYEVIRVPASGGATDRELPDVLAGKDGQFLAIEVKASTEKPIYADKSEIDDLKKFADNFGATAVLGIRFDRTPWYFAKPSVCHKTDAGTRRMKLENAERKCITLEELDSEDPDWIPDTELSLSFRDLVDAAEISGYVCLQTERYHKRRVCSGSSHDTRMAAHEAIERGYEPCGNCCSGTWSEVLE